MDIVVALEQEEENLQRQL